MKKQIIYCIFLGLIFITGCQKEKSFEQGNTPSTGSLQSNANGDCLPKTVNGSYVAGVALVAANNTIIIDVNVTKSGTYTIGTDTVNGYYFRTTGRFTATGNNIVTLIGNGTPFASGVNNFKVSFEGSVCDVQITVAPAGTLPGVFTLVGTGTPASCSGAVINGMYVKNVALNTSNTVDIAVNVTTVGTYSITTTFQGMTFSKSGTFTATGNQTIQLNGSGTPTVSGINTVPLSVGSSACNFAVTVGDAAVMTLNCATATVNGTYQAGTALIAANTITLPVTVTTAGTYNITTAAVNGITFSSSGNVSTSTTSIVLTGAGTPVASGASVIAVAFGASTCNITVTVTAGTTSDYFPRTINSNWSYEFDDNIDPTDTILQKVHTAMHSALGNSYNIFLATDDISFGFDSAGYYRKSGGDYYQYADMSDYIGFQSPAQWAEFIFLKDNVPATTTWFSASFSGTTAGPPVTSYTIRLKFTISQKDIAKTVVTSKGTVNYQNVIVVKEEYQQFTGGVWVDLTSTIGYGNSYYARNVGLIEYDYIDNAGITQFKMELRRSQIF